MIEEMQLLLSLSGVVDLPGMFVRRRRTLVSRDRWSWGEYIRPVLADGTFRRLLWRARHTLMAAFQVVRRNGSIGIHDSLPSASRGGSSYLGRTVAFVVTVRQQKISPSLSTFLLPDVFRRGYPAEARPFMWTNHRWLFFGNYFLGHFLFTSRRRGLRSHAACAAWAMILAMCNMMHLRGDVMCYVSSLKYTTC